MQEIKTQENESNKCKKVNLLFEKIRSLMERGKFQEVGQKRMRESEKKRLIRKQRQAKYSNILERKQDVVFENQQFIKQFRAKMVREKIEQIQIEYQKNQLVSRPRNNQMINKSSIPNKFNPQESYNNMMTGDYTEIETYLELQQSKNILDRVEKKELQLLQAQDQNASLSFSQSMNFAFNSVLPQQKRIFPFENYQPKYKESDLNQLAIEEGCCEIDGGITGNGNEILCFTQYNDQYFSFALSNGLIVVRDVITKRCYEVYCYQSFNDKKSNVGARDITCLQLAPDLRHILASHETGALSMYDFKYAKNIFYIKNLFKYSSSELESRSNSNLFIIDFKVIAQNSQKDEVFLLAVNAWGDCILSKIFKGFLSFENQIVHLMKHELFPLTQISVLGKSMQANYFQYDYDKEDDFIVGISSPEKLFIIRIKLQKMKAKLLFRHVEKQDTIIKKVKNSFAWGEIKLTKDHQLMFLVSFSNNLYIGILSKVQEESIKDQGKMKIRNKYGFDLKKRIRHYTSIQFIGAIFRNIFLLCDFNNQFYLINSTDLRSSFSKYISLSYINSFKIQLPNIGFKQTNFNLDSTQLKAQRIVKQSIENANMRSSSFRADDNVPFVQQSEQPINEQEIRVSKRQITYSNNVSFSILLQKCYILLDKPIETTSNKSQFACISLVSWRQTLEELIKQGEYLNSMSFLYSIHLGYHKFSHNGLQKYSLKDLLVPQIERTALNFTEKVLKQFKEEQISQNLEQSSFTLKEDKTISSSHSSINSSVNTQINETFCDVQFLNEHDRIVFCMEFLVECQLPECIFYEIRPMCCKILGSMEYFIECVEPFILEGKITHVPNEVLTDIIDYYQQRNNLRTIQQILTSLDLKHLDTKPLVQLSMEKQLITALIYLSTRAQIPDFITPLMIFWNQFVTSLRQWEQRYKGKSKSFMQKSSPLNPEERQSLTHQGGEIESILREVDNDEEEFLKEQIILSLVRDPLKIKCEYYGLRALWYFRLCLQQRLIDGEYISDENYKQLTLSFEAWISFPDNIRVSLQRWPQVFFQVLKIFFSEKPMKIINTDPNKLKQYIKDIDIDKLKEQTAEFCGNKKRMLYSEVLLRQVICIAVEIDSSFDIVTRSTVGRNAYSFNDEQNYGYYTQENQEDDPNEDSTDLTGYQLFVEKSNPAEFDGRLNMRRQNLKSSFYIFLANLIYQSQCSTQSSYLGGLFQFSTNKVIEIVFYITQHHKSLDTLEFTQEELQKQAKIYYEGRDDVIDYRELAQLMRSDFLLSLIMYILPYINNTNSNTNNNNNNSNNNNNNNQQNLQYLSQLLDLTEFATARSHILLLREHYHRAIDSYIQSPNKTMNRLIFDWMWQNLTQSQTEDQKKFELLKEIMRTKLPDFIKIDSEKTHQLFQKFLNDAEHDIISQLKNNPSLQLLYIQNVIKQYKLKIKVDPSAAESMKFDSSILILNIQLMCQLNKPEEDVLSEITSLDFYPFKEILKICLDKSYLEVCSHIYLRMGLQDQALRQQIKMLENTLNEYKKYLEDFFSKMYNLTNESLIRPLNVLMGDLMDRHQSYQFGIDNFENDEENDSRINVFGQRTESQFINNSIYINDLQQMNGAINPNEQISKFNKKIELRMQQMFEICQINKQPDSSDNWFLMLDLLIEIGKKHPDMDTQDSLKNLRRIYAQIIGNTLMEIANYIDMDDFLNKLRNSYTDISIADLKETFSQLLQNSIDSYKILFNCLDYIQQDLMNLMNSGAETFLKGTHSQNYCFTCFDTLNSMDKIKRKIRKQVISRSQISLNSSVSTDSSIALTHQNSMTEDEEDDSNQIIIFQCGHSYHKECYYKQKSVKICLECVGAKNKLYFLIISRQDIDFSKLTLFIKKQQELLLEKFVLNRNSSDISSSRSNSYFDTIKSVMDEEMDEIKKFNKLRRINKLKTFDKVKQQKYSYFENEPIIVRKQKVTS